MELWLIYVEDLPRLPWYHHTTTYVHHIWNVYVCMWWLDTITTPQGEELGGQIRPLFLPAATFCNLLTVFFLARSTFDMLPGAALITSHRRGVRGLVDPPCHVWSLPSILFHDLPWHPPPLDSVGHHRWCWAIINLWSAGRNARLGCLLLPEWPTNQTWEITSSGAHLLIIIVSIKVISQLAIYSAFFFCIPYNFSCCYRRDSPTKPWNYFILSSFATFLFASSPTATSIIIIAFLDLLYYWKWSILRDPKFSSALKCFSPIKVWLMQGWGRGKSTKGRRQACCIGRLVGLAGSLG